MSSDNKVITQKFDDHVLNYVSANHFYIEIGSAIQACFSECSGVGVQIDKEVYFEGGVNDQQRIFLKQAKYSDVTLKRGITNDLTFWEWISQLLDIGKGQGKPSKRLNMTILVFNQAGEVIQNWTLIGAIPIGWKAPSLQANSNTMAIEELTLAYEGLRIKTQDVKWKEQGTIKDKIKNQGEERDAKKGYFSSDRQ